MVDDFGGLIGIPNPDYINKAINRPQSYMDYDDSCDIHLVASLILDSIARYHPFADGNKRTALISTIMTYRMNKMSMEYTLMTNIELEELVIDVASSKGTLTVRQVRSRLKKIVEKYSKNE